MECNLIDRDLFLPEKLGSKKVLFAREFNNPMVDLFVTPNNVSLSWGYDMKLGCLGSLFAKLSPLVSNRSSWIYITYPDDAWLQFEWERKCGRVEETWKTVLWTFESEAAIENGTQIIALVLNDRSAVIQFLRGIYSPPDVKSGALGFEIAVFGSEQKIDEISGIIR